MQRNKTHLLYPFFSESIGLALMSMSPDMSAIVAEFRDCETLAARKSSRILLDTYRLDYKCGDSRISSKVELLFAFSKHHQSLGITTYTIADAPFLWPGYVLPSLE